MYLRERIKQLLEKNRQQRIYIEQLEGDLETLATNAMRRFNQFEKQIAELRSIILEIEDGIQRSNT